jgi:HAE1 family hydrophobic/amphiphilic exporter-1
VESDIVGPMREQGKLGGLYRVSLSGTADKLAETGRALRWNFLLALVITYLLMSALFESFLYPFVIMFSVPLAALGGFLGLRVMNLFSYQALDTLTMLGFIILVGTVVNNAILIVHQSLNHMREEGMAHREAIRESVSNRIRPIFMSVTTSVFAMLPLVLFPGAGSELYRGLGSVVVGGLIISTVFTLFLVPALFSLTLDIRAVLTARIYGWLHPAERPAGDD